MKSFRLCMLALALLAFISVACNSSARIIPGPAPMRQVPTASQPMLKVSDFPRGRFGATSSPNMVVLFIENDGHFRIYVDSALLDSGRIEIAGSQVLVDSLTCSSQGDKAWAYKWFYDVEEGLAFQPVASDPCPERRQYLSEQFVPRYMFVFNMTDGGLSS